MLSQDNLGRGQPAKNDVLHFERQFFDATNRILNAGANPVNDMKIRFQFLAQHSDWVEHAVLAVDVIMLDD